MKKHARFSASSAMRWVKCPGSILLSDQMPPLPESSYAAHGTAAHLVLEMLLKTHHKGGNIQKAAALYKKKYDEQMVLDALDAVYEIERLTPEGSFVASEERLKLDFICPDMGGTADYVIAEPYGKLIIIDYKYGTQFVDPKENLQLICYALAAAHQYDYEFEEVKLVIIQPRVLGDDVAPVREWVTDMKDLKKWIDVFGYAANNALSPDARFEAGGHCYYCPAAAICPELKDKSLKEIQADFNDETGVIVLPAENPPIKNLGNVLDACLKLESWIERVREYAFAELQKGKQVSGWKLVQKRAIRKWKDEEAVSALARKALGENAFSKPELISPAQFEKKFPVYFENLFQNHISNESSGLTIAPEHDKRPPFNLYES